MKNLSTGMKVHLATGLTTLCSCWRVTKRDGERLGFTDHDNTLAFDGTTFEAKAGFTATDMESTVGLAVGNLEVAGALQSGQLDEEALQSGELDGAEIEIWRVNWSNVAERVLMRKGHLGEVTSGAGQFAAEIRGLAHLLNQVRGRLYGYSCDAELGDARCKVDLEGASLKAAATVLVVDGARFEVSDVQGFPSDWFNNGQLEYVSGLNVGLRSRIKRHRRLASVARIDIWQALPRLVSVGDQIILRAGCDRQFKTCRTKFNNATNYRGFPHMPGNDVIMQVASGADETE
jgi:uncharacterized phage protein (TIGR02218 family)